MRRQILAAALAASMLTACGGSARYRAAPPVLADAPAALAVPCAAPVTLPSSGGLTQAQAVAAWGRDRVELETCGERHAATVDFYRARDAALRGDDDRH